MPAQRGQKCDKHRPRAATVGKQSNQCVAIKVSVSTHSLSGKYDVGASQFAKSTGERLSGWMHRLKPRLHQAFPRRGPAHRRSCMNHLIHQDGSGPLGNGMGSG